MLGFEYAKTLLFVAIEVIVAINITAATAVTANARTFSLCIRCGFYLTLSELSEIRPLNK